MNNDTELLLRECNSGIKMGMNSIKNVLPYAKGEEMRRILNACSDKHAVLGDKAHKALLKINADTKPPHAAARVMAKMKIKAEVSLNPKNKKIADVMTDGCNMGIKSIYKYLNLYSGASNEAKQIANDLISAEQELRTDLRCFL